VTVGPGGTHPKAATAGKPPGGPGTAGKQQDMGSARYGKGKGRRPMGQLQQEVAPEAVGLDPARLARLDRHLAGHVDSGRLSGYLISVARHGQVAHLATYGLRDREAGLPVTVDTLWRMYSMTKPVTSVAALMLLEEGLLSLNDPISRYLPAFAETRVYQGGPPSAIQTRAAEEPIRVWHLMTHTAGLTYGHYGVHPVDALYREAGLESRPQGMDLAAACDLYASLPLQFEPGSQWNYSVATDVLGRLVEVVSGRPLDEFFAERIFGPLGMDDAGFFVEEERADRLAALYESVDQARAVPIPGPDLAGRPEFLSGGGGMVAGALDYHYFMEMLRRRGEFGGTRLLGPRTVDYMATNHLPGGVDILEFAGPLHRDPAYDGIGFGLGVSVTVDPVKAKVLASPGDYGWSGAASTFFWVDPREDLTVQFLTQLRPAPGDRIGSRLRFEAKQLVRQALVD
jgi:CubicO group peptidase (beta-lactamase class C family)